MVGRGVSTVSSILEEVSKVLVDHLWNNCVSVHMPDSKEAFKKNPQHGKTLAVPVLLGSNRQLPYPNTCPPGGLEVCKEYHNFKIFYSIVLMAMVDSKYRFVWGRCGFP